MYAQQQTFELVILIIYYQYCWFLSTLRRVIGTKGTPVMMVVFFCHCPPATDFYLNCVLGMAGNHPLYSLEIDYTIYCAVVYHTRPLF